MPCSSAVRASASICGIEEHLQEFEPQQHAWRPIDERMRRGVREDDFQLRVEIDNSDVHEIGEELAILRLIRQVAFEPGVVRLELLDAVDRVAFGPDPRQCSDAPKGDVRAAMRDECDDEADRQRDRDDGPGIHGPSIAYGPDLARLSGGAAPRAAVVDRP